MPGVLVHFVLQPQRLRELVGGGAVVGVQRQRFAGGAFGVRPARGLQVGLRFGGKGGAAMRVEIQRGLGGGKRFLRTIEGAEDETLQHVVISLIGLDGDGLPDGRQSIPTALGDLKLAAGEMVKREGVVRIGGERFLKGLQRVGIAAQFLELQGAEKLWSRPEPAHFLIPMKVSTSS